MELTQDFLVLNACSSFAEQRVKDSRYQNDFTFQDVYELPSIDLTPYKCMIINGLIDQEYLNKEKARIADFLAQGKVILFGGHLFRPWLPGGSSFIPKTIRSFNDYAITFANPHPIFEGVEPDDLTYNKGVAGFFARGHHPLPPEAEVLLFLGGAEPIMYIDRLSTKGTIVVHAGSDLLSYSNHPNTAGRITPQLIDWIRSEYKQIQERNAG
ncbi:phosphate starvation-inducible protein PhoH [Paenibacillus sp. FSL H7-0331]|jgi:hypothetical protein|uniref:phosphate starvation-inducible protein PhoH n=1 Tax=Paenibacillus sp. FSL H7-0331 TaxID=1920421 RepID=UPI00096E0195|nr:phosphate starvation-inducible protein PhoH [Paenibacillus sp. FSL H7-0331]OMF20034.1 phosphate starvation-inducible protein PhoH [Paenibacillus sp. FSL H7-0331]